MTERNFAFRAAAAYHFLVAGLSIAGGIALLVTTMHRFRTIQDKDHALHVMKVRRYAEDSAVVLLGLTSLLAARRRCIGVTFRIFYLICVVVVAIALVLRIVHSARQISPAGQHKEREWFQTVFNGSFACISQQYLKCNGLDDGACEGCLPGNLTVCKTPPKCVDCSNYNKKSNFTLASPQAGCWGKMKKRIMFISTRYLIISSVLLLALSLDLFLSCKYPLHVADIMMAEAPEEMEVTS